MLENTKACQYVQHTKNVVDYCKKIGKKEKANNEVLIPAAILHDIGRYKDNSLQGHVDEGLLIVKDILKQICYPEQYIDDIIIAIDEHHCDLPNKIPSTIEGRILLDADRIEIVGPYGMTRWFLAIDGTTSPQDACKMWLGLSERKALGRNTFFCTDAGESFGMNLYEYSKIFCMDIINR